MEGNTALILISAKITKAIQSSESQGRIDRKRLQERGTFSLSIRVASYYIS
jgi:hypothetical protein